MTKPRTMAADALLTDLVNDYEGVVEEGVIELVKQGLINVENEMRPDSGAEVAALDPPWTGEGFDVWLPAHDAGVVAAFLDANVTWELGVKVVDALNDGRHRNVSTSDGGIVRDAILAAIRPAPDPAGSPERPGTEL